MGDNTQDVDVRKPAPTRIGIGEALQKFRDECPPGTVAINLGCGQDRMAGFVNVDWMADDAVDVACDLFNPNWPIADESVGFVYMNNFLEHVPGSAWGTLWNELWRICADGARIMVISPHARSDRYLQDPTHCQPMIDAKFLYTNKKWRIENKLNHGYYCGPDVNFLMDIQSWKLWHQDYAPREDTVKRYAELHDTNVITDQIWYLRAFKTEEGMAAFVQKLEAEMGGQEAQGRPIAG